MVRRFGSVNVLKVLCWGLNNVQSNLIKFCSPNLLRWLPYMYLPVRPATLDQFLNSGVLPDDFYRLGNGGGLGF